MYKKTFSAVTAEENARTKTIIAEKKPEKVEVEEEEVFAPHAPEEEKVPLTEKIKSMLSRMFEVEDQSIK
jgi:hypothetical protein